MNTTQRLDESTLEKLKHFGKMGESFNDVLDKVLNKYEELEERVSEIEDDIDEEPQDG